MSLIIIDNYDSFTYNLAQYCAELGAAVTVYRNDQISVEQLAALQPQQLIISPGPGTPDQAGIALAVIQHFAGRIPLLGVCLGHQSIGQAFGGQIIRAPQALHGKISEIHHRGQGVFAGLPSPFPAVRYHSLVIDPQTLPDSLEVSAWTETAPGALECIMAVQHRTLPVVGVQFHPESILTAHGHTLLRNFLRPH